MNVGLAAVIGTIAGIAVAVGFFLLAARFVARAREGTRRVRQAHHDPHAARTPRQRHDNDGRDIKQ